jgi:hypothetical protein
MKAKDALKQAKAVITAYKLGVINYETAQSNCKPLIEIANKRVKEIAKKHGVRPRFISFTSLTR